MNIEKILHELDNNAQILYLDSSSLIRSYPLTFLSKNITRAKYASNPHKFTIILNNLISPIYNHSKELYDVINKLINSTKNFYVITYDCMFEDTINQKIHPLFGQFTFVDNTIHINNTTILYGQNISVETFYIVSTLIRSTDLIIVDDYFLSLSVGMSLVSRKKDETPLITLSSVIGSSAYGTEEILNIFNFLYTNHQCS